MEITKATYYKYKRSVQYMQEFLTAQYRVKNYTLKKITTKFLEDYFHFLRIDRKISHNVAKRYIEFVKAIIYPAVRIGVVKNDPFRELRIKMKPVIREFLTQVEIDKLLQLEAKDEDLERKKDFFLFACFTVESRDFGHIV